MVLVFKSSKNLKSNRIRYVLNKEKDLNDKKIIIFEILATDWIVIWYLCSEVLAGFWVLE